MKMVKSLVLGSAAGLVAMTGAQAADLPVKAKAVEYVRICSLYGAGFFYIPGTDTCIKFGGYLRVDTTFNGGPQGQPAWNGDLGQQNRYADYFATRARMAFSVDTRTQTEQPEHEPRQQPAAARYSRRRLHLDRIHLHPVRGLHRRQVRLCLRFAVAGL